MERHIPETHMATVVQTANARMMGILEWESALWFSAELHAIQILKDAILIPALWMPSALMENWILGRIATQILLPRHSAESMKNALYASVFRKHSAGIVLYKNQTIMGWKSSVKHLKYSLMHRAEQAMLGSARKGMQNAGISAFMKANA